MSVSSILKALVISSVLAIAACSAVPADQLASLNIPTYDAPAN